jgi:hypothetical protein
MKGNLLSALERFLKRGKSAQDAANAIIDKAIGAQSGGAIAIQILTMPGAKDEDRPIDYSPRLDSLLFRDVVEQVSALNLGDLAHELDCLCAEFPLLIESRHYPPIGQTRNGYRMAVAFEAGRRYNIFQVYSLLGEEVDCLPAKPPTAPQGPQIVN